VEVLRERFAHLDLTFSIGGQISFDVFPRVRRCAAGLTALPQPAAAPAPARVVLLLGARHGKQWGGGSGRAERQ
jgi:hypothetical protein